MGEMGYTAQSHMNQMDQFCYRVKKHFCICVWEQVRQLEKCMCAACLYNVYVLESRSRTLRLILFLCRVQRQSLCVAA